MMESATQESSAAAGPDAPDAKPASLLTSAGSSAPPPGRSRARPPQGVYTAALVKTYRVDVTSPAGYTGPSGA